jgi:hypothetical protein
MSLSSVTTNAAWCRGHRPRRIFEGHASDPDERSALVVERLGRSGGRSRADGEEPEQEAEG